jgi:hypothetical protein
MRFHKRPIRHSATIKAICRIQPTGTASQPRLLRIIARAAPIRIFSAFSVDSRLNRFAQQTT